MSFDVGHPFTRYSSTLQVCVTDSVRIFAPQNKCNYNVAQSYEESGCAKSRGKKAKRKTGTAMGGLREERFGGIERGVESDSDGWWEWKRVVVKRVGVKRVVVKLVVVKLEQ